ncbi:MAG: hypothetical protein V3S37_00240, partial [Dehalococcoidia bacterium]
LGVGTTHAIPNWFHEGVARNYEFGGLGKSFDRSWNRLQVWFARRDLLSANAFCSYNPRVRQGNVDEIRLFYDTSMEFVAHITRTKRATEIAFATKESMDFEGTLFDTMSLGCEELYSAWKNDLL